MTRAWSGGLVAVDAVGVLLPGDHSLAGGEEVELADLADARWAATPGDGCLADCFAAACARARFTPKPMYEVDVRTIIDLVESRQAAGRRAAAVAAPARLAPGRARAASVADRVYEHAVGAYNDSLVHASTYATWLERHPRFGAVTA